MFFCRGILVSFSFLCCCSLYFSDTECPSYDLVLWTDGSGVLANCSLCGIKVTLFFLAGPVYSSFSIEACAILQALGWSRQDQQVCHFSYLTLALSSPPCLLLHLSFYLNLCQKLFSLSSSCIRLQWVPGHSFLPGDDLADELARWRAILVPSVIPCSLSSLISRIHSSLFSDWRHTVSSKFFDTQVPSIYTEEVMLLPHSRCVLSRLRCNGHSLLLSSYFSRMGTVENPCCSACGHPFQDIFHFILHCPTTDSLRRSLFGNFLSFYDLWPRPWGIARVLGHHGLPPSNHPSEGVV